MTDVASDRSVEVEINIYQEHILPIIKSAVAGDELLFVTPSTFFGFYSVGARTYEDVCRSLRDAKSRGVIVRILIDVRDVLTATAAQGLLSFLRDGAELRDMQENRGTYFLMCSHKDGHSDFVRLVTEPERNVEFLPNVNVRPFAAVRGDVALLTETGAYARREEFETLWNMARARVRDSIIRYEPWFYLKRRFAFVQVASLVGFFACGSLFGITVITRYRDLKLSVWAIFAYVLSTVVLGVAAGVITGWITRRVFGRN